MTRLRRAWSLGALGLLAVTMAGGLLSLGSDAGAAQRHPRAKPTPPLIPVNLFDYRTFDAGNPNSSIKLFGPMLMTVGIVFPQGRLQLERVQALIAYGDDAVLYSLPIPKVDQSVVPTPGQGLNSSPQGRFLQLGEQLYEQNCAACHGVYADGVPPSGTPGGGFPVLQGLGPATVDFWVESGRMPATDRALTQQNRRPARLHHRDALAIAAFVNSLQPATPYLPSVNQKGADISMGFELFSLNCAACHTITGDGDALANDTFAPSLRNIPAYQVAEALRTGPANMPVFTGNLTDTQLRDVVNYVVRKIQHPQNPGGLGLGGLGPVGEGFIGLAIGVGLLAVVGFWVGDRS